MKTTNALAAVLLIFGLIALVPMFTIWSVNHLFNAGWVIDVPTWFSVFWLSAILSGGLSAAGSKKK